jgi:hypothetical protein
MKRVLSLHRNGIDTGVCIVTKIEAVCTQMNNDLKVLHRTFWGTVKME